MWPLVALFWLFGPVRIVAQLFAVLLGALAAAATAAVAGRVLRRSYALAAGLIVALFPSQVLWSSLVLRESLIWAGLAGIALVVVYSQRSSSVVRILGSTLVAGLLFWVLANTRIQTAALALWCMFPALLFGRGRRVVRALSAIGVLVVAPLVIGMGMGAATFAEQTIFRLGFSHATLSVNAQSSFMSEPDPVEVSEPDQLSQPDPGEETQPGLVWEGSRWPGQLESGEEAEPGLVVETTGSTVVAFQRITGVECKAHLEQELGETQQILYVSDRLLDRLRRELVCISDGQGGAILVDNTLGANLSRLPRGLFNTMVRPLPWEIELSSPEKFGAGLESPLWLVLYGLSGYCIWKRRKRLASMVFPVLMAGGIAMSGAVTHGNLGTAFRHRGQVVFALAILSAGGLQAIADRRNGRRNGRINADSTRPVLSSPVGPNPCADTAT